MHEVKEKVQKLCEMKDILVNCMKAQLDKGTECLDTEEAGKVVDMIKDLCDAEKNLWKACYYKTVTKAMEEYGEEDENERFGYDNWRYSSGKFAPSGHGKFSAGHGYTPMKDITRMYRDEKMINPRMGYVDLMTSNSWNNDPMGMTESNMRTNQNMMNSRYGMNYDNYQDARRHYTSSHDKKDKDEMDRYAMEHVADTVMTVKEIWAQADPETKKKLKADLGSLMTMVNSTT